MRQNNYKENNSFQRMRSIQKRGQATIFIIVALVIVGIIIVLLVYPRISSIVSSSQNPQDYLRNCIEPKAKEIFINISDHGGYLNPEGYIMYQGEKIKYLCYTSQYYQTCVVQEPMIERTFERQTAIALQKDLSSCLDDLKNEYNSKGYEVRGASQGEINIEVQQSKIVLNVNSPLVITKDSTQTFDSFNIQIKSNMAELLAIADSIVQFESTYGDSETTAYLQYYPNLKIEKTKLSDGSKIYRLTNVVSGESFTFASRSLSWPPGYQLQ